MAGVRTYRFNDPNIWRFPEWEPNVFYPAGSFVAMDDIEANIIDSDSPSFNFYVASVDVPVGIVSPQDSDAVWLTTSIALNPWVIAFDSNFATLAARIDALTPLYQLIGIDSDIRVLQRSDSDFRVHDSEQDSEIRRAFHNLLAGDSDVLIEVLRRTDSDKHDWKAADSDIIVMIRDNDSDILMELHDRAAFDSDALVMFSDHDSDILMERHDRAAADSDIQTRISILNYTIRQDLDSDLVQLRNSRDSDSDRLTNFIHRYEERDSDIESKFRDLDSEIAAIGDSDWRADLDSDLRRLREADSDFRIQISNLDSDIIQAVHDYLSNDSEFDSDLKQIIHDFLYHDSDLWHNVWEADSDLGKRIDDNDSDIRWLMGRDSDYTTSIDSDIRALKDKDSDLEIRIIDNDSDIAWLRNRIIEMESEEDSDNAVTRGDHDSDLKQTYHDFKNGDSDLQTQITDNDSDILWLYDRDSDFTTSIDSDILALKSTDSDQWVAIIDNDSDIAWLRNRIIEMESEEDSDNAVTKGDHDSDLKQTYHDFKNGDSDLQTQVWDNDSDIQWLYDRDSDFTTSIDSDILALKSTDSDQWVAIKDNDSDIVWLRNRIVEMEDEEDSDNAVTRGDHDSDLKQTYHDFKNGDSDLQIQITDNDSDIRWLYNRDSDFTTSIDSDILALQSSDSDMWIVIRDNDSEIHRMLDSEFHDRREADSDFNIRIVDNDSDIKELYQWKIDYRDINVDFGSFT